MTSLCAGHKDHEPLVRRPLHPICALLRRLRVAAGLSLNQFEEQYGISAVVVGAYERGDRLPPLHRLDEILSCYGYHLVAQPIGGVTVVRPDDDVITTLRSIADQLENRNGLPDLSEAAA